MYLRMLTNRQGRNTVQIVGRKFFYRRYDKPVLAAANNLSSIASALGFTSAHKKKRSEPHATALHNIFEIQIGFRGSFFNKSLSEIGMKTKTKN